MPQKTIRLFRKPQSASLPLRVSPLRLLSQNSQADRFDLPTRPLLLGQAYLRGDGELPLHHPPTLHTPPHMSMHPLPSKSERTAKNTLNR